LNDLFQEGRIEHDGLIEYDGPIEIDTASFAGRFDLPAFIAWLGSGADPPGTQQEQQRRPRAREACRS